jgi:hypothetical protein
MNLGVFDIPEDLSEVDAHWVYCVLSDSTDPFIEDIAEFLGWFTLDGLAYDLRDTWHTARCESMEWERDRPHDYE